LSFEFLKSIVNRIKLLDGEVCEYKTFGRNPYIPAIAYVNWAIHLAEMGKFEDAEDKLISSTHMAYQTPEAYIHLALLKIKEQNFEEAYDLLDKSIRLDRRNARAYCFLGNVLTEVGNYKDAEKKFKVAQKLEPNNSDIFLNWGISLIKQRKFVEAREKLQKACKLNMSNFTALYFWGIVELELGDNEKAKAKFQLIISVIHNHYEALYYLAYIKFKEKNYRESLNYALRSLEFYTKKTETYMLIAENYMFLGDEANSLKYYEMGEKEAPVNYYFLISWGTTLQKFNQFEESKTKFQSAVEMDSENDLGYACLGLSNYRTNNTDEAMEIFDKTLKINPQNIVALENLGQIHFEKQEYQISISYFEQVIKNSAKAIKNYHKIANAYFLDNNLTKAGEYFKKASEYQPDEIYVHIGYAKVLLAQRDYKLALRKIRTAYKLDENNIDCLNILFYVNYVLAKENLYDYNIGDAIRLAEKIEKSHPDLFRYPNEKEELISILKDRH